MRKTRQFELPDELKADHKKAKQLEYWTIGYMLTAIILMYLVMGSSQAMKSAWAEDLLTLVAPLSFLIASRVAVKAPNVKFPFGYHRVNSIAFLVGAVALFFMGIFLVYDSVSVLLKQEHTTIHSIQIYGETVWMGWIMIAVLVYSAVGPIILGLKKLPLAERLHSKVLYTDAQTNKADYLTAGAACLGVLGIGMGLWWADAVAAIIISVDILHDGYRNMSSAITDLMNRIPRKVNEKEYDPLVKQLQHMFNSLSWVESAEVRLREEGQVYFGDVTVIPRADTVSLVDKIEEAREKAFDIDWKIFDLVISPVNEIPEESREALNSRNQHPE